MTDASDPQDGRTRSDIAPHARLQRVVRERFAGRRIVIVSNREPVIHVRADDGSVTTLQPASGLTTALMPVVQACGGTWVAHGSGSADFDVLDGRDGLAWPPASPAFRLRRVRLSPEIELGYYYGLSNEGLWPLCHLAYTEPVFRHTDWAAYEHANEIFAAAVLDEVRSAPAIVLIQDYHFALLPGLLRRKRPDLLIGHFWHIPWPNRQTMRVLPWQDLVLEGLLGNDLLGFQVQSHCNNFLDTVDRAIEARVDYEHHRAMRGGRATYVRPFPISIDAKGYADAAERASFESAFPALAAAVRDQVLLLGVDRLDYTKGIPHRLRIFEVLLERRPDLRGKISLVQVSAPTRTSIGRYEATAREVAELVAHVNERFATSEWTPVHHLDLHHDRDLLAALYRRADACLVTSLHDGMNLVAKEYVAAHAGRPGTLVLSKFTGAARELLEACLINPFDIEGSAEVLAEALELPERLRGEAMARLHRRVCSHDVYDWATDMLEALDEVWRRGEAQRFPGN